MAQKILVADDSLTVQKVVSITLASYDYELIECKDESTLNEQLMIGEADLLLLDLNLSENKSGYDIVKEVKSQHPNISIILLLGTFDTVDESQISENSISERIVKPFDSNIFIQKIQAVLENVINIDTNNLNINEDTSFLGSDLEEVSLDTNNFGNDDGSDWVVDSPAPVDNSSDDWDGLEEITPQGNSQDKLTASLEGWGMNVPAPIEAKISESDMLIPPVIENTKTTQEKEFEIVHDEEKVPSEEDLDYPYLGSPKEEVPQGEQSVFKEIGHKPTSALTTNDNFDFDTSEDEILEKTNPQFHVPTEDLASSIEEEEDVDDFWAADIDDGEEASIEEEVSAEEDGDEYFAEPENDEPLDINLGDSISLDSLDDSVESEPFLLKPEAKVSESIDQAAIIEKIMKDLKPMLSQLVESYCKETIETVAWQVIPDLAENLIRNEIKEIKEKNS